MAAVYFWVSSAERFGATLAQHGADIYRDIANFSKTQPVRGLGRSGLTSLQVLLRR